MPIWIQAVVKVIWIVDINPGKLPTFRKILSIQQPGCIVCANKGFAVISLAPERVKSARIPLGYTAHYFKELDKGLVLLWSCLVDSLQIERVLISGERVSFFCMFYGLLDTASPVG